MEITLTIKSDDPAEIAKLFASFASSGINLSTGGTKRTVGQTFEIAQTSTPQERDDVNNLPKWAERLRPRTSVPVEVKTVADSAGLDEEQLNELAAAMKVPDLASIIQDDNQLYT